MVANSLRDDGKVSAIKLDEFISEFAGSLNFVGSTIEGSEALSASEPSLRAVVWSTNYQAALAAFSKYRREKIQQNTIGGTSDVTEVVLPVRRDESCEEI